MAMTIIIINQKLTVFTDFYIFYNLKNIALIASKANSVVFYSPSISNVLGLHKRRRAMTIKLLNNIFNRIMYSVIQRTLVIAPLLYSCAPTTILEERAMAF